MLMRKISFRVSSMASGLAVTTITYGMLSMLHGSRTLVHLLECIRQLPFMEGRSA